MNRNIFVVALVIAAIALVYPAASFAEETKAASTQVKEVAASKMPMPPRPNFGMIAGAILSIDNTDPANIKLTVKNDADGSVRAVTVTPWTNITKVIDASELKIGEQVRMMTRRADDKDVAMGIMSGKVKNMPAPQTAARQAPAPQGTAPEQAVKK